MFPSAVLPDPAHPGIVPYGATLGALAGGAIARALRYGADKQMRWAVDGSYYGSGIAFVL